jgi:hypothetical protein
MKQKYHLKIRKLKQEDQKEKTRFGKQKQYHNTEECQKKKI